MLLLRLVYLLAVLPPPPPLPARHSLGTVPQPFPVLISQPNASKVRGMIPFD